MALWDVILYLESGWFCTNACGRILDVRVILNNFLIYVYIFEKKNSEVIRSSSNNSEFSIFKFISSPC